MSNEKEEKIDYKISDDLRELFDSKHKISKEIISKLKTTNVQNIKQIVLGKIPMISKGDRIKTISVLIKLDERDSCDILGNIIANETEDTDIRAIAALNLSYLPNKNSEIELIKNLGVKDNLIKTKIIKSLGCIGTQEALNALDKLPESNVDYVRKQLNFSKALIAFRLGLKRDDLPFIEGTKRKPSKDETQIKLTLEPILQDELKKHLDLFDDSNYGINFSNDFGYQLIAGKAKWFFTINKEFISKDANLAIIKQKMIVGLLNRWLKEAKKYEVQYIVLANPKKDSIEIMVVQSNGEIVYSGYGNIRDSTMTFTISDISRAGTAPTYVSGKLVNRKIQLDIMIASPKRIEKKSPVTINLEDFNKMFSNNNQ